MNTQERYLTPNEVADTLRVTSRTVRNWLRNGKLRGVKLMGDNWVIPEDALTTLLHPDSANTAVSADGPGALDKSAKSTANAEGEKQAVVSVEAGKLAAVAAAPSPMANRKNKRR